PRRPPAGFSRSRGWTRLGASWDPDAVGSPSRPCGWSHGSESGRRAAALVRRRASAGAPRERLPADAGEQVSSDAGGRSGWIACGDGHARERERARDGAGRDGELAARRGSRHPAVTALTLRDFLEERIRADEAREI